MLPEMNQPFSARDAFRPFVVAAFLTIFTFGGIHAGEPVKPKRFPTPDEAVNAFVTSLKLNDDRELMSIFGTEGKALISSGDPVSDKRRREQFLSNYETKNRLIPEEGHLVLTIGEKDWPFPVPLMKDGYRWFFDTAAGKEEILNRRIGENELSTVQTLLAIVDAQREYAMADHDGDGIREYAEKFRSDPGKKNGLYWVTTETEEPSPLGELVANARAEGYSRTGSTQNPIPYHGYYFRMLKKQGEHAAGRAFDYFVKDNMIGGFAVVAYPSAYGSSGVMTFMVNHRGVVYEKDLGDHTEETAKAMNAFDPDDTWDPVE
jgi:hypothetical protein